MRSSWYVEVETSSRVVIVDAGDHARFATVTNDAEAVVAALSRGEGGVDAPLGARQLLYRDSEGALDELRHDGRGRFLGFAPFRKELDT